MISHKQLDSWKLSMQLMVKVYKSTSRFPAKEFNFKSQMNRAALSIPSNIAEGAARNSTKDYVRFLHVSLASAAEIETQYIAAKMLGFIKSEDDYEDLIESVLKLLSAQIQSLKRKPAPLIRNWLLSG